MADGEEELVKLTYPDDAGLPETVTYQTADLLAQHAPTIPHLLVARGPSCLGRVFRLRKECTIGRALSCEIQLPEHGISRRHAMARMVPGPNVLIEDLGSRNGLFFQGERVPRRILRPGESIQVGSAMLTLVLMDDVELARDMPRPDTMDPATRLPNRRYLLSHLDDAIDYARQYGGAVSTAILSVDEANDAFDVGGMRGLDDVVLRVAQLAADLVRVEDACIARLGPALVGLSLPETGIEGAVTSVSWLCRAASELRPGSSSSRSTTTLRGGVAAYPANGVSRGEELLAVAERERLRAILDVGTIIKPTYPPRAPHAGR